MQIAIPASPSSGGNVLSNWKTTLAGILAIGATISPILTAISKGDNAAALAQLPAIITGVGLILAKDFNVKI